MWSIRITAIAACVLYSQNCVFAQCPSEPLRTTIGWQSLFSPKRVPGKYECQITIEAVSDDRVEIMVAQFQMATPSCNKQSVTIYEGQISETTILATLCGDVSPRRVASSGHKLIIRVFSDYQAPRDRVAYGHVRFEIKYRAKIRVEKVNARKHQNRLEGTKSNANPGRFQMRQPGAANPAGPVRLKMATGMNRGGAGNNNPHHNSEHHNSDTQPHLHGEARKAPARKAMGANRMGGRMPPGRSQKPRVPMYGNRYDEYREDSTQKTLLPDKPPSTKLSGIGIAGIMGAIAFVVIVGVAIRYLYVKYLAEKDEEEPDDDVFEKKPSEETTVEDSKCDPDQPAEKRKDSTATLEL